MSEPIPVFVNDQALRLPGTATVREAVRAFDPALADRLPPPGQEAEGTATRVTDARGLPLSPEAPLHAGAILRVARSARATPGGADADA